MRTLISAKHVTKIYENGEQKKNVIDDVSLTVEEGEFIAIMGPSGAGKSTLLYALSGMEPIDEGSITFDGVELARCSEKKLTDIRRKKMGFVFQRPTLLKNLNLLDNIIFPALDDAKDRKTKKEIVERGRELMRRTGILELEHRSMDKASGGQLQRVGICRALMNHPDILFGDEPTGALDSKSTEEIMELFEEINRQGTAIVLVTHDEKVAKRAKKILYVKDGKLFSQLPIDTVG